MAHHWTTDQVKYLKKITPGRHHDEITQLINQKFNLNLKLSQVRSKINQSGFKTGYTGHFQKGNRPWNKGLKICTNNKTTQFKKGHLPSNCRKVGVEMLRTDGFIEVKVAQPNVWKLKHHLIWEQHHGPIPEGHCVIFADRNKQNLDINNLILVSYEQLLLLNKQKFIKSNAELTKTAVALTAVQAKLQQIKRNSRR